MENEDWHEIVESLVNAKRCLANVWQILDGSDGNGSRRGADALNSALSSIDAMYAVAHRNAYNADVASPVEVQQFWAKHGSLPGFAEGR